MRKHNQIHTLGAPHYKAHFQFLRKLKDFKCTLWSKNTVFLYKSRSVCLLCESRHKWYAKLGASACHWKLVGMRAIGCWPLN